MASLLKRASRIQNSPAVQKNKDVVPYPTINHKDLFILDPDRRTAAETVLDVLTQDTQRGFQSREQKMELEQLRAKFAHLLMTATRQKPMAEQDWKEYDANLRSLIV